MLPYPFFGREDDKFFPCLIKDCHFIFTIFEAKGIGWKIETLHGVKIWFLENRSKRQEARSKRQKAKGKSEKGRRKKKEARGEVMSVKRQK